MSLKFLLLGLITPTTLMLAVDVFAVIFAVFLLSAELYFP